MGNNREQELKRAEQENELYLLKKVFNQAPGSNQVDVASWIQLKVQEKTIVQIKRSFADLSSSELERRNTGLPSNGPPVSEYTLLSMLSKYGTPEQKKLGQSFVERQDLLQQFLTSLVDMNFEARARIGVLSPSRISAAKERALNEFLFLDGKELNLFIEDSLKKTPLDQIQKACLKLSNHPEGNLDQKSFLRTVGEFGTYDQRVFAETVNFLQKNVSNIEKVQEFFKQLSLPGAAPNADQKGYPDTGMFLQCARDFGGNAQKAWANKEALASPEKDRDLSFREHSEDGRVVSEEAVVIHAPTFSPAEITIEIPESFGPEDVELVSSPSSSADDEFRDDPSPRSTNSNNDESDAPSPPSKSRSLR